MAKIITIANQKGGVGKSTTVLSIADALSRCEYRVLVVDTDPQCNSTRSYLAETENQTTLYDLFNKSINLESDDPAELIQKTEMGDIVACDPSLSGIESSFTGNPSNFFILRNFLHKIEGNYDYIVIDTPPTLGFYMLSSLIASNGIIIPISPAKYALDGLALIYKTISDTKLNFNPNLEIYGVLLTMYDKRNALDKKIWAQLPELGEELGFKVFPNPIRKCQAIADVQAKTGGKLYTDYPNSNAAVDYATIIKTLIQ